MPHRDGPAGPIFTCMSTNALTSGTESSTPNKFYVPAATSDGSEGRIERLLTTLYDRHQLFTRRLE